MAIDESTIASETLYTHLKSYGFNDEYLHGNVRGCMVSMVKSDFFDYYESGLQPVQKKYRSKNHIIPVSRFLHPGDMLKFSNELKFMIPSPLKISDFFKNPFGTTIAIAFLLYGKIKGLDLERMSYIEGWVCSYENPSFLEFPFDQWLTITSIEQTTLNLCAQDGRMWKLGAVALTAPEQVDYCSASAARIFDR